MDESELREVMDANLSGSYEVHVLHQTSETPYELTGEEHTIGIDHQTEIEVRIYTDNAKPALLNLRKVENKIAGLRLESREMQDYLEGEVEVRASFVLAEDTVPVEPGACVPVSGAEGEESGAESEAEETPREGQVDVESAHTAVLKVYTGDGEVHLLREGGRGGACGHQHAGAVVADVDEQYDSLSALLEDGDLCRECGAILVHQFNLPPGRVPGSLRRWADGG